jgi:ATP/maltotriose-dependent transcriptional regulator MalT
MIRPVSADGRIDTGGIFEPIPRPRVVARVAAAAFQRIALIVAPAGYGKSVALRQYLDTVSDNKVLYDVRAEHSTLLGFLRGFCDVLLEVAPDARKTLSGAYEKSLASANPGLDLAMWMFAHIKSFAGIVAIDDLHITEGDPEIARFLVSLIERTKGRARWILASRSTTNLPVGSWLAYGDMDLTIDDEDLRFSVDEARLAAKASRVSVRDGELNEILSMTAGWPTAISFALRSSTRSVDLRNVAATTREMVYQYLAEQVYHSLDQDDRSLLHLAAYLGEVSADVLRHAGYTKARASIESLRQRVAFIYQDRPGCYKCHDLFRDFLQHQLELEGDGAVNATKRRAAQALEKNSQISAALVLYASLQATEEILRLLMSFGFQLVEQGHADAVGLALDGLSPEIRATNPVVLGLRALSEADLGRFDRSESLFARAIAQKCPATLRAELSIRLGLLLVNQMRGVATILEPLADEDLPVNLRAEIASLLAVSYAYESEQGKADEAISDANFFLKDVDDNKCRAKILQRIGVASLRLRKPLEEVVDLQNRAASLASEEGLFALAGRAFVALASISLSYEDDSAKEIWFSQQAANAAMKAGDLFNLQTALLHLLNVEGRRGNVERIKALEQQIAPISTSDVKRMSYIIPVRAYMAAWEGRFDEAHRLMATIFGSERFVSHDRAVNYASDALFVLATGQREAGIALVAGALAEVDASDVSLLYARRQTEIATILCALAEGIAGRHTYARRLLRRTSKVCDPPIGALKDAVVAVYRSIQDPIVEPSVAERLDILSSVGHGGLARLLQSVFNRCRPTNSSELDLTPTEMEILDALAAGRRPKDIAHDTARSIYTVQAHIQNIIKKLGCSGRSEALRVARARGLIA